jgi:hypothetical protein
MSSWRGVPDFARPVRLNTGMSTTLDWQIYPAVDEPNLFVYLPSRLEIALRERSTSGTPELDFSIESVRGMNPFKPPQPYGVLDFRLHPAPFPAEELQALQQEYPQAAMVPALFTRGWLHLQFLATTDNINDPGATGFEAPTLLASNGLETARCIRRLTQDQLSLLKRVLQEETLSFTAWAEMELWGLAPRLAACLEFDPTALLRALQQSADEQGLLSFNILVDFWLKRLAADGATPPDPPIKFLDAAGMSGASPVTTATATDQILLAQTLADWTAAEFTEMFASPALSANPDAPQPVLRLIQSPDLPAARRWDLRQEKLVPALVTLRFNPFEAVQQVVKANGLSSVLTETVVPALETGVVSLTLAANLPDNLQGVLQLGVNLLAPAHPPERIQPLTASLLLDKSQALYTVNWRFSPIEDIQYQYTCFALMEFQAASGGSIIRRLEGAPTNHAGNYLLMSMGDFPLGFVPIKASELLLQQASISGICSYADPGSGALFELSFELNAAQPVVSLCLPAASLASAHLRVEAHSLGQDDARVLEIGEFPARSLWLDILHLHEYGSHMIDLQVTFDTLDGLLVIDLLPEDKLDQPEQATPLSFVPAQPTRAWTYFARSPFRAGYVYRLHAPAVSTPGPWSSVQSPFEPLVLKASQLSEFSANEQNQ